MHKNSWLLIIPLLLIGFCQGVELDFALLKDVIATPTYYSYYDGNNTSPFGALVAAGFPISDAFRLCIRGSYTGATINIKSSGYLTNFDSDITGFRLQGVAMASAPINSEKLLLQVGIGLGYHYYSVESKAEDEYWGDYDIESSLSGLAQTFILGTRFLITERLGIVIEAERIGLNLIKETYKAYDEEGDRLGDRKGNFIEPNNSFNFGISAGISLLF